MKTYLLIAVAALGGALVVMVFIEKKAENQTVSEQIGGVIDDTKNVTLPPNLPSNVPMYPGAQLDKVSDSNTADERNVTLTLITPDSVPDVITWYRGALSGDGWAVTDDKNVSGYILLKAENDNVTTFMQSATVEDGATTITQRIRIRPVAQ